MLLVTLVRVINEEFEWNTECLRAVDNVSEPAVTLNLLFLARLFWCGSRDGKGFEDVL